MKILIFLILVAIVVSWYLWNWRITQAEENLARRQILEHKREQKKESMTPVDMTWPTVSLPTDEEPEEAAEIDGPSMTSIEFVPPEQMT
ncbi:hypothetical protein ACFL1V_04855 [Pseudomonadota bacterium]